MSSTCHAPSPCLSATRSTWPFPSTRASSVRGLTRMFGVFSICSIRYRRHRVAQRLAAHDDLHLRRVARQMHRRLSGRVPTADDEDASAAERRRLRRRRAVVDAGARVRRHARRRMLAVLHAGCGQHGPRDDLAAVAERQLLVSRVDGDAGDLERHEQLGAEPLRLRDGAPRQFAAADAGVESRDSSRFCELLPAWPPGACRSSNSVRSPSEAP